ncbi:unnamed protein product [Miscanthus lutarioriparius]|uniref:Chromo domain-containing protein n=1 Tax=Miscanthus lutarioriparius TaxID=422564 RepID=A0A811RSM8_9POAL|nr:unnamed protein product [Miscanthus lutarioriparius]
MKRQADKHRSQRQFSVGDWVFLKLQPYVQSSLARRANLKLSFGFFGPYKILARIGAVADKLELPTSSSIHSVFHVSQLKASHGKHSVTDDLPDELVQLQVPQAILDRRWTSGTSPVEEVLVQWSRMPPSLATWERLVPLSSVSRVRQPGVMPALKEKGLSTLHLLMLTLKIHPTREQARPVHKRRPNAKVTGPEWEA